MLDQILAFLLLVVIPGRALWRSRPARRETASKTSRYITSIVIVATLLVLLAANWHFATRPLADLGLTMPITPPALIGFGISFTLLAILWLLRSSGAAKAGDKGRTHELAPDTPRETRLFVILAMVLGFGWEVLYRGFLLFYLTPLVGIVAAVALSAVAYGAGHGFTSASTFAGSMVAALAFTVGYAVTGNLWWLIVLHIGLPLLALPIRRKEPAVPDKR